jgi:hypothetical protein
LVLVARRFSNAFQLGIAPGGDYPNRAAVVPRHHRLAAEVAARGVEAGKQNRRCHFGLAGREAGYKKQSEMERMKRKLSMNWSCIALAIAIPVMALAATPSSTAKKEPPAKSVELFAGMESGEIEAVLIQKDSTEGTVMIKNKSDQPLTVKMPEAFAGVPILAQRGGRGGGVGGMGGGMGGMGGGGMQGMGGGMMGGMGGGMGGMGGGMGGMGGGMFNVAPDKVQKIKIGTVCLDHGLTDPSPRVPYKPVPIDTYAKDPAIAELVKMMCHGQIDQHSAQAAAWHIQNGLSWEVLANKVGVKHIDGRTEPYFTAAHLERAFGAARFAKEQAEKASKEKSSKSSIGEELATQQ